MRRIDSLSNLGRWDNTDQRVSLIDENGVVLWEVLMLMQGLLILATQPLALKDNDWHLVDYPLPFVPPVQRIYQVTAHHKIHLVSLSVPILQLVHQKGCWDAWAIFHFDWVDFDRKIRWEEVIHGRSCHFKSLLRRWKVFLVRSCPTWHESNLIEAKQIDSLRGNLNMTTNKTKYKY